ncbi:MAG: hypothetical protein KKA64_04185 [Nanoarchaeota archaeon]|nr:hypothetical protein [Nanoarchaeota archaeon]
MKYSNKKGILKKIHVLGISGSGKSYLAKKLSGLLKIPCFDLDDIFWLKKYTKKRTIKSMKKELKKLTSKEKWIVEGVYSSWVNDSIKKSDMIILLESSPNILSWRIFKRYILRGKSRESFREMCDLIKFARSYRKKEGYYHKYKSLLNKYKVSYVFLNGKKDIQLFLKEIVGGIKV